MPYIRDASLERTGFQESGNYNSQYDFGNDFVMVYGVTDTLNERVEAYKSRGYVVHLMTGISWGGYTDFLYGKWDGLNHWDSAQTDVDGKPILHGTDCPYMVPTVSFADYMAERLKKAVDAGVEAIHIEEPEFWDRAGYSPAFKREYELYYREPWQPPHLSLDARYKAAKLKLYLFKRTIDRVGNVLKAYAKEKYSRTLRFYVPTHSLVNYTQWKIISPEGSLTDVPSLDGYIAQVWTGTSRTKNVYGGKFAERTFETAYLEYGIMQELVRGTNRQMWFLHDPIEDNPAYDWDDYRKNYLKTVTASLLNDSVNTYEICPWPRRVVGGKYPVGSPDACGISPEYLTLLCNIFQTLGDIDEKGTRSDANAGLRVGILLADSALCERDLPDGIIPGKTAQHKEGTVIADEAAFISSCENSFFKGENPDSCRNDMLSFMCSGAFPAFYGLCLPLLKYGIPVRPVSLDNVRRYPGYLDDYDVLLLSYEYMKPAYPEINNALAAWTAAGGKLIYAGDGSNPYFSVDEWWNTGKKRYSNPAEHLFELLGLGKNPGTVTAPFGKGTAAVITENPATFCCSNRNADCMRSFYIRATGAEKSVFKNYISLKRGVYSVSAVFEEGPDNSPLYHRGLFADMYSEDFDILSEKILYPGDNSLLFDFGEIAGVSFRVIGTSVRIISEQHSGSSAELSVRGAEGVNARIRLRLPFVPTAATLGGMAIPFEYDSASATVLLKFASSTETRKLVLCK